jgi:hypothetical protein
MCLYMCVRGEGVSVYVCTYVCVCVRHESLNWQIFYFHLHTLLPFLSLTPFFFFFFFFFLHHSYLFVTTHTPTTSPPPLAGKDAGSDSSINTIDTKLNRRESHMTVKRRNSTAPNVLFNFTCDSETSLVFERDPDVR